MAKPVIFYKTMLRSAAATITDPGTEPGFSLADIHDFRSFSLWKSDSTTSPVDIDIDLGGSPEAADYMMVVNHNMGTVGDEVRVFADSFTPPTTSRGAIATVAGETLSYITFTSPGALRYWRVRLFDSGGTFSDNPFIGELFLGLKTELPQFLTPDFDPFFKQVEVQGSRSRGGHYLGASLRGQRHRGEISFGEAGAARAAFTSDLNAFLDDHAFLRRPFGFVVDTADSDFDTCRYIKVPDDNNPRRNAVGGTWQNLTFDLPVEEAYSEPA